MATSLGRYEILRQIGSGGSADVYEALDTSLSRTVALKVLRGEDAKMVERLHREAAAAAQLRHPNIVSVHDVGEEGGSHYIAMDFIPGATLAEAMRHMTLRRRAEVLLVISRAVAFAHQHGIIHRDLKPHNILIDASSGTPFLSDFGLAKLERSNALTRTGAALGTPYYMAPEQVQGLKNQIGPHTDVWALGVILYELIADHPPFSAATPVDIYSRILGREPAALRGAPPDLQTIAFKALEKGPSKRYRTAEAFANDLDRHLKGQSILAKPPSFVSIVWRRVKRSPIPSSLIGALVMALLVIAGLVVAQEGRARSAARGNLTEAQAILATLPVRPATKEARQTTLQELIKADHLLQLAQQPDLRYDVNRRLGNLALDGADFALARLAFSTCRSLRPGENLEPLVVEREQADLKKRKIRLEEILDDLRQGFSRPGRPPGAPLLEDFVFEAVQFSDEQTVQVLADALKPLAARAEKDTLWAQEERDLMTFAFRVLGRLDRDSAVAPLALIMDRLWDHALAVECGLALCNTRRAAADGPLQAAQSRLGINSHAWNQVSRRYARVPTAETDTPHDAIAFNNRGLARLKRGDLDGAIEDYTRAIEIDPLCADAFTNRGNARLRKSDVDGAIEDYSRAIGINPRSADALTCRGHARYLKRDPEGAMADLSRAIEIDPRSAYALNNRGIARHRTGDFAGAISDLSLALQLDPRSVFALTNRGNARYSAHDLDGAIEDYTRAIEIDPHHPDAFNNRGLARRDRGDENGAIADYSKAIEIDPLYANAYTNRGCARSRRGDLEGAIADHTAALGIDPRNATALYNRGAARNRKGDLDGAIADWQRLLESAPLDSAAPEVRSAIRQARARLAERR